MYRINREKNDIIKMEKRLFSDLHFTERGHLQEWIAKHPDVLGEDLLIIQKEYAGFNDTKERLDLLALDKDGGLVIIENKLDDTGRDVVWQALKYTSYCSTLTTKQVIRLYQEYLDSTAAGEDAKELLMEFLGLEDDDGLALNPEDQRIIFIANSYRKEVTSTALWLLEHDINLQCFRATPYSFGAFCSSTLVFLPSLATASIVSTALPHTSLINSEASAPNSCAFRASLHAPFMSPK